MKIIKNVILNLVLLGIAVFFSYYFSGYLYDPIYSLIYGKSDGGFFAIYVQAAKFLAILILSFIFSTILLFTAFGASRKYWGIGILLIPAGLIEIYFGWNQIYIPIFIGLVGWLIGFAISKLVRKYLNYSN